METAVGCILRGMEPPNGLWATAPYLHNGAVPTLWHLMHAAERPRRFPVGGHRLDFRKVGVDLERGGDGEYRYPAGYVPWSRPEACSAAGPGMGNGGHVKPFDEMSEAEKARLLEFLKLL